MKNEIFKGGRGAVEGKQQAESQKQRSMLSPKQGDRGGKKLPKEKAPTQNAQSRGSRDSRQGTLDTSGAHSFGGGRLSS